MIERNSEHTEIWNRLVARGFHLLYHDFAWSYDAVAWLVSLGKWQQWGETALAYVEGQRVLELGHGPGYLLVSMRERGLRPFGLDASPQMGRLARLRLRQAGHPSSVARGRAQELPFPACTFDTIVATFPTAFILDPRTLAETMRVLRPGGRFIVVLGATLTGYGPIDRFVEWLYAVTGQRQASSAETWESSFLAVGLKACTLQIETQKSLVHLLVAEETQATRHDKSSHRTGSG